jgi:hypothetical protein
MVLTPARPNADTSITKPDTAACLPKSTLVIKSPLSSTWKNARIKSAALATLSAIDLTISTVVVDVNVNRTFSPLTG